MAAAALGVLLLLWNELGAMGGRPVGVALMLLVALAAHSGAYWAFSLLPRKPDRAAIVFAISLAAGLYWAAHRVFIG